MNKKKNKKEAKKKNYKILENKIRVVSHKNIDNSFDKKYTYYIMYFEKMEMLVIFKGDISNKNKTELPILTIGLDELYNVNFRIPQKLKDMSLEFKQENKLIMLKFQDESIKDQMGDILKKKIKENKSLEKKVEKYNKTERKYYIAKILESKLKRNEF